jgi:hypothetical protein
VCTPSAPSIGLSAWAALGARCIRETFLEVLATAEVSASSPSDSKQATYGAIPDISDSLLYESPKNLLTMVKFLYEGTLSSVGLGVLVAAGPSLALRSRPRVSRLVPGWKARDAVSMEPLHEQAYVTRKFVVSQGQEPGVVIAMSDYDRLIERLDDCKPSGWADLWLAGAGAGAALAAAALVGVLTMSVTPSGTRGVLWALTAAGTTVFALCLVGYLAHRRDHTREIRELRKDLEIHRPKAAAR